MSDEAAAAGAPPRELVMFNAQLLATQVTPSVGEHPLLGRVVAIQYEFTGGMLEIVLDPDAAEAAAEGQLRMAKSARRRIQPATPQDAEHAARVMRATKGIAGSTGR